MAKYISAERLTKFQQSMFAREADREAELRLLTLLINECKELNSWIPLEEFLKSGFIGKCWVLAANDTVHEARYSNNEFNDVASPIYYYDHGNIKGVMPIHKPEPPQDD